MKWLCHVRHMYALITIIADLSVSNTMRQSDELDAKTGVSRFSLTVRGQEGAGVGDKQTVPFASSALNVHGRDQAYKDGEIRDVLDRQKRCIACPRAYPNTVYYVYDKGFKIRFRGTYSISRAAQYWQDNTCINFKNSLPPTCQRAATCNRNHIIVAGNNGCYTKRGTISGTFVINIGPTCSKTRNAVSQIGYALGLSDAGGCPYQQYGHQGLSFCRLRNANQQFCSGTCRRPVSCQHGGYPHPRYCNRCVCPPDRRGASCQTRCSHLPCRGGSQVGRPSCRFSRWRSWTDCSSSCGSGMQYRTRQIIRGDKGTCSHYSLIERRSCARRQCAAVQHCILSQWTEWSQCTKRCGSCYVYRSRSVLQEGANGGRPCGAFCREDVKRKPLPAC